MALKLNLKRLRESKGLTQEQLAELVGVSVMTISRCEHGRRWPASTGLAIIYKKALGVA